MEFKYFDRIYSLKLLGGGMLTFVGLCILVHRFDNIMAPRICVPLILVGAVIFLFLKRKSFTKKGNCKIYSDRIVFDLNGQQFLIHFSEIRAYKIQHINGILLKIKPYTGRSIVIQANSNFHDSFGLEQVCKAIENAVEEYNLQQTAKVKRVPSFFEKRWALPVLVIFSALIIFCMLYALVSGKKSNSSLFIALSALATLWGGYLSTKKTS